MRQTDVNGLLNKIGKRIFVQFYHEFRDLSISNQDVISMLPAEFTFKSRTSRTSKSRRLFREHLDHEALSIIASSDRVDAESASSARALLAEYYASQG